MTYITNDGTIVVEYSFLKTTVEELEAICLLINNRLQRITDTKVQVTVSKGEHFVEKDPSICVSIRMIGKRMKLDQLVECAEVVKIVIKKFHSLTCTIDDLKPLFNELKRFPTQDEQTMYENTGLLHPNCQEHDAVAINHPPKNNRGLYEKNWN